jgi:uncharacterized protein YjiS (DUF1127 family)
LSPAQFAPKRRLVRHLQDFWRSLRAAWARRRIERDTQAELHALDGRALHDLGLDRSQIPSLAAAAARFGPGRLHDNRTLATRSTGRTGA